MRKVILYIASSIDGYIAREDGSIDWLSMVDVPATEDEPAQDYGYNTFIEGIDTVLMGRKTYEQVLTFEGEYPYSGKHSIVFSSTPREPDQNATFWSGGARELIESLSGKDGGDIWLVGGGTLIKEFVEEDLIDKYIISLIPIILGSGIPLFHPAGREIHLRTVNAVQYPTGLVELVHKRKRR